MSEELIQQLDPQRDYGVRTYEDVVREVREGQLFLKEGPTHQPVISDTLSLIHISEPTRPY